MDRIISPYLFFYKHKKLIIFLSCFCVLYFGIKGFIGITAKGGSYIFFLDEIMDEIMDEIIDEIIDKNKNEL